MPVLPISRFPRRLLALTALLVVPQALLASVHHAVAPARHEAPRSSATRSHGATELDRHAAQPARASRSRAHAEPAPAHGKVRGGAHEAMQERAVPARHGKGLTVAVRGGHHGEEERSTERAVARAGDNAPAGRARGRAGRSALVRDEEPTHHAKPSRHGVIEVSRPAARESIGKAHRSARETAEMDSAADDTTQTRVHNWYRTQEVAGNGAVHATARATRSAPAVDLSTAPQKATAEDFARAAAAQRMTIRSAAEQNSRQTTAADDAADAQTHIPSTAPTEREPAPFVHGNGTEAPAPVGSSGNRRLPAPIVRQRPEASKALASMLPKGTLTSSREAGQTAAANVDLSAPAAITAQAAPAVAHVDLHTARPPRRNTPAGTDAAVLAANPIALAADSSPRAIRAVAAETAAAPTPHLQLPAPPVAGRKPAIAAIQAGDAHPVLDPAVSAGMADETFDGDNVPATAGTAIRLATTGTAAHGRALPDPDGDTAGTRAAIPVTLYDGGGRLLLLPPMKGTHEILVHQNQMAVSDGLERIQNDGQLASMRRTGLLVALPDDDSIYPNDALPLNRRYARPWTVRFLRDIARAHYARFGTPLIVTSAVRTVEFQRRLVRINGNAAPPTGDIASPHLYGQAIDFAKHGMSLTEITWMRAYLSPVENDGKIDVEEEFQQACFHISVYRRYLGVPAPQKAAAPPVLQQAKAAPTPTPETKHRLPTALLATHLP